MSSTVTGIDDAIIDTPSFGDVPIDCITASKTNPRKIFDDEALADLAASIRKHGVAQPILLRPTHTDEHNVTFFEVVAGERRFRASKLAGKTTVPAIVRNLSNAEALEIQVIENLQRQDLHPLEEAEGFEVLMFENGYSADVMAEKTGKSKAYIYASLKLTELQPIPRKAFYEGRLNKSTALLVARIPLKHLQETCVEEITREHNPFSARAAAKHIERYYMLDLTRAKFDTENGSLNPGRGGCVNCHWRTGNQPEIFTDVSADVCTDPVCFKAKTDEHNVRVIKLATKNGQAVISGAAAAKIKAHSHSSMTGGYVELDKVSHYPGQDGRTFREILGDATPKSTLLEVPGTDDIIEIVKSVDITHLLKAKGIDAFEKNGEVKSEHTAREKEAERKAKIERDYRSTLFTAVHHASLMENLIDADLRVIAVLMFEQLPGGTIQKKLVMELYDWTEEGTLSYPDRPGKLRAAIAAFSPAQLNQFIRDCSLSHELFVYTHTNTEKDAPHNLLAAAKRLKIDAYSIKAQINEAAKAKAKSKLDAANYAADKKTRDAEKRAAKANMAALDDMTQLTPEQVPAFLKAFPNRINELTEFALENRPLFIAPIDAYALEAGYQYAGDSFIKLGDIGAGILQAKAEESAAPADAGEVQDVAGIEPADAPAPAAVVDDDADFIAQGFTPIAEDGPVETLATEPVAAPSHETNKPSARKPKATKTPKSKD